MIKKIGLLLTIISLNFTNPSAFALNFREHLNGKITDISTSGNRIIIERGIEDGVVAGDYARIYLDKNLIGSAVVIDLENNLSEWVFHRLYRQNNLKTQQEVTLVSLYGDKKPPIANFSEYSKNSMLKKNREMEKKKYLDSIQNIKEERKMGINKIIKDYDSYQTLSLPPISAEIYASPVELKSGNRTTQYHLGTNIETSHNDEHFFKLGYQYQYKSFKSIIPNNNYSYTKHHAEGRYIREGFWAGSNYAGLLSFDRESEKGIYMVRSQVRIGPIGIEHYFIRENKRIKKLSFTYIPIKEYYSYDSIQNGNISSPTIKQKSTIRHHLEGTLAIEIMEKMLLTENFIYRPSHQLFSGSYNHDDSDMLNTLSVNYEFFPYFLFGVQNKISRDIRRRESIGYPATQTENSIQIFYQFDKRNDKL